MPQEIITTRIAQLSTDYRGFIESDFIAEVATSFGEVSGFDERKTEILENALTLYLLFLLNEADTVAFISRNCEISLEDASQLFTAITVSLPEGLNEMVREHFSQMNSTPQATALDSEIAETERAFENLQGIRTMAADMREAQTHSVPTYQSNQSDLIQSSTPTPPPQNGPRWETDK